MAKRNKKFREKITITYLQVDPLATMVGECFICPGEEEVYKITSYDASTGFLTADVITINPYREYKFSHNVTIKKMPDYTEYLKPEVYEEIKYYVLMINIYEARLRKSISGYHDYDE